MKSLTLILIILLTPYYGIAQFDYNTVLPKSPNASSLGQYADVPVSYYTGTPNISIPLGVINGSGIELPITLSYMARGVKVEDNGSWVGTNFSLNCAGVVSQTIRGIKDGDQPLVEFPLPTGIADMKDVLVNIQDGFLDPEGDLYHFNFSGYSGTFVLDRNGRAIIEGYKDIKIASDTLAASFVIITEDGTHYFFADLWETSGGFPSSVNLSRIVSASGKDTIDFTYTTEKFSYYSPRRVLKWVRPNGNGAPLVVEDPSGTIFPVNVIYGRRLVTITTNFGQRVEFVPETGIRADFPDEELGIEPRMLSRIEFYDQHDNLTNVVQFEYEIVETAIPYDQLNPYDPSETAVAYLNNRIYLKGVRQKSPDQTQELPPYEFAYEGRTVQNKDLLPNRLSSAQDHWGYYNGHNGNTDLWPGYNGPFGRYDYNLALMEACAADYIGILSTPSFNISGANRDARMPYASYGTLKTIKYPTGGYTNFQFESHKYIYDVSTTELVVTKPVTVVSQVHVSGSSQTLVATDTLNASMEVTFEFEMNVTCWDPNTHLPLDCDEEDAQVNFDKFQGNSIELLNSANDEILAIKWVPGDGGFWVYRDGLVVDTIGILQPDYSGYISLPINLIVKADDYTLRTTKDPDCDTDVFGWLWYTEMVPIDISNPEEAKTAGGLRIKQVESFDANNNSIGVKSYEYGTGVLQNGPKYGYVYLKHGVPGFIPSCPEYGVRIDADSLDFLEDPFPYLEIGIGQPVALGYTQGSPIGYQYVTESQPGNGSVTYEYTTSLNYVDEASEPTVVSSLFFENNVEKCVPTNTWVDEVVDVFKFFTNPVINSPAPIDCDSTYISNLSEIVSWSFSTQVVWPFFSKNNFEWKNGFLKKVTYKDNSGFPLFVKESAPLITNKAVVGAIRVQTIAPFINWLYGTYFYSAGTINIGSETESHALALSKTVNRYHESPYHNFVTKQVTIDSNGDTITTEFRYPDDYENITDPNHVVTQMKSGNRHIIGSPVETRTYKNGKAIEGTINSSAKFNKANGGFFVGPKSAYTLKRNVTNPAIPWSADPTSPDTIYFSRESDFDFDNKGNLIKATPRDQVDIAFLWEQGNPYPVAKVTHAEPSEIFFQSFESNGTPSDQNNPAKTGDRYFNSGTYNFSTHGDFLPPNPSGLNMSYWYWSGNVWNFSGVVPFQNTFNSSGSRLDEIRVFPKGSQMITYTYHQLVGITSQTDPNNNTIYYEYDDFGRLKLLRDQDGNVVETYQYHYKDEN